MLIIRNLAADQTTEDFPILPTFPEVLIQLDFAKERKHKRVFFPLRRRRLSRIQKHSRGRY